MRGGHRDSQRIDSDRELMYVRCTEKNPKEEDKWEPVGSRSKTWETR